MDEGNGGIRADFLTERVAQLVVDVGDDDFGAVLGEESGRDFANATGAAGDDGDFAIEPAK